MTFDDFLQELGFGQLPHGDRFGKWLGYQVRSYSRTPGSVETTLKIREDHLSPSRAVHGGVISAFLDFSCGSAVIASLEPGQLCSTVELKVNYFRPLSEGDEITARAQVEFKGKRLAAVQGSLYRGDEKVAMASGTFNIYSMAK